MGFEEKQKVSALVDDELALDQSLSHLKADPELQQAWGRYHLIGDLMRDEAPYADLDISDAVSAAVAQEATVLAPTAKESNPEVIPAQDSSNVISFGKKLWQQAGGFAIAASVAMIALYNAPNANVNNNSQQPVLAQVATAPVASSSEVMTASAENRLELQTMHEMFITHEQLAQRGANGLPSIHVVSNQKVIPITVNIPMRPEAKEVESVETQEASN